MSKTKIFIVVIALAAIGAVAIIISSKSPTSTGISEKTGVEKDSVSDTQVQEDTSVSDTQVQEDTSVSETQAPGDTELTEKVPSGKLIEPQAQEFEGIKYEIININYNIDGDNKALYDIVTGKLTEEQAKTLAEKIIRDATAENSPIKEITLLFYSDKSSATAGKYDVSFITWVPNKISVKMINTF